MRQNQTLLFAIVVAVGIVAILVFSQGTPQFPKYSFNRSTARPYPFTSPTGKVDDATNAVLTASAQEEAIASEDDKDAGLVGADSREINELGQSYNDNDL